MASIHVLSLLLPPLFAVLRRSGVHATLAVGLLMPLAASAGMYLLHGLFLVALEPQCTHFGTFL